jgi:protein SCO1/2
VILTPTGKIARYLLGLDFAVRDLRLGLVEAAAQRIGTPLDRVLLFCYAYNASSGQYNLLVLKLVRLVAGISVVGIVGGVLILLKKAN